MLVSTVDAWCRPPDFAGFVDAARRRPLEATVLAVTPLVEDEKPLWVTLGPDRCVESFGDPRGGMVTAGVYRVSDRARRLAPTVRLGRLREYLSWLVEAGEPVYGEVIETVVDVDRGEDVASAEALAERRVRPA